MYVAPADLAQFLADLEMLAISTRQRAGNISYAAATDDPRRLLFSERWADQAALSAHLAAIDTLSFIHRWRGRMRGDVRKYDALNERDLMAD